MITIKQNTHCHVLGVEQVFRFLGNQSFSQALYYQITTYQIKVQSWSRFSMDQKVLF